MPESKKLLEDIPNKARDTMGIMVDVNLKAHDGLEYLEIVVESYPYPVSFRGQYHYRSGSTKQELKGAALDKFLLSKQGKRWDAVPVPHVSVKHLDQSAYAYFMESVTNNHRLGTGVRNEGFGAILERLHLFEGSHLKRAAILLFHPAPEKLITGAYVKIGYFKTDDENCCFKM